MTKKLSLLGFERFAAHAQMTFVLGYTYSGDLDVEAFKKATTLLYQNLYKTSYNYNLNSTNKFWAKDNSNNSLGDIIAQPDNLQKALIDINKNALTMLRIPESPLGFTVRVVFNNDKTEDEDFLVAFIINHAYFDGRSGIHLYNTLLKLYHCITTNNEHEKLSCLEEIRTLSTVSCLDVFLELPERKQSIILKRMPAPLKSDSGQSGTRITELTKKRPESNTVDQLFSYPMNEAFKNRQGISKNSIISALLCKSYVHFIEAKHSLKPEKLSFGMVAAVLDSEQQKKYVGNYTVVFNIEIELKNKSLMQIAEDIQKQVKDDRRNNIEHQSMLEGEKVFSQPLQEFKDERAFFVTNWVNHDHLKQSTTPDKWSLFNSYGTLSTIPRNRVQGCFVQRQGIIVCLSPNDVLNIAFTPTVSLYGERVEELDISGMTKWMNSAIEALKSE